MNPKEVINSALISIRANKVRAFLTMLGVIIGVFSVVTLVSLGKGIENYITDEFEALGTNLLFISPGDAGLGDDPAKAFTNNKLDEKHIDLIEKHADDYVVLISPYLISGNTVEYKANSFFAESTGISSDALDIINYEIAEGRMFTDTEQRNKSNVVVLGPQVEDELFSGSAVGNKVRIDGEAYEVIGTFEPKGDNYDDQVLIPYTTMAEQLDIENFASIVVKTSNDVEVDVALKQVELAMLRDLDPDDFTVLSQADLLASIQEILGILTAGLGAIAGISLVVGGIGIMNIMLVSVTERTREIGLRKAVGANSTNIAMQFLSEAFVISIVGGTIGLVLGWLVSLSLRGFLRTEVPLYAVVLAFGFSAAVGLVFGTYPAVKASSKDPIEALRYE